MRFQFVVRDSKHLRKQLAAFLVLAPVIAGCSGASDMFQSDLLSKDAEWFSRPGRLFIKNVSIDAPPLTPNRPITPDDLVSAEGACPGMPPPGGPADANASTETSPPGAAPPAPGAAPSAPGAPAAPGAAPPATAGTVALGHTECDVVRGIGAPDSVNLSKNARGDRVAVVTWKEGPRAGIYTFKAGRLSDIEGVPAPPEPPKTAKHKAKKKAAT